MFGPPDTCFVAHKMPATPRQTTRLLPVVPHLPPLEGGMLVANVLHTSGLNEDHIVYELCDRHYYAFKSRRHVSRAFRGLAFTTVRGSPSLRVRM